jgi:hypothetical protein
MTSFLPEGAVQIGEDFIPVTLERSSLQNSLELTYFVCHYY